MTTKQELGSRIEKNLHQVLLKWLDNQFSTELLSRWKITWAENVNRDQIIPTYLTPLIKLLIGYLKSGNVVFLYGYLNERLRYAPHREPLAIRAAFFKEVLSKDIEAITSGLYESEAEREIVNALLNDLHRPLIEVNDKNNIGMLTLGDCLMTEIRVFLPQMCRDEGITLDMRGIYFSARMNVGISLDEVVDFVKNNKVDLIAMSFLSYEALPIYTMLLKECDTLPREDVDQRIDMIVDMIADKLDELRTHTEATFLIHNTSGLPLGRFRKRLPLLPAFSSGKRHVVETINNRLELLVQSIRNAILIDEYETARKAGFKKCAREVFPKSITSGGMLHTGYLGYYLSSPYLKVLNAFKNLGKCKAIMLDFDNTLWQGVMGDGEVEHFSDRQALLKRLKEMGILLISVSKNSEENIRWDEMVLKYDDFVLHKINWDLKIQSITSAVAELNIGMDSIIFIDDNPVEIELVKQELKDIVVLDATKESTWSQLEMMLSFPNTKETDESRKRTEMYRQSFERKKSLNQEKYDYPKLMASLELKVSFRKALKGDLERIDELVNRTNQFNTTTIRYSKDELHAMMEGSLHELYVATLSDKFGSLGVVLVVILELQGTTTVINSFIMSCRAMGFALENQVMHLLTTPDFMTHTKLVGLFKETDRNTPCASLYKNSHFTESAEGEWVYYPGKDIPLPAINWIEMVE